MLLERLNLAVALLILTCGYWQIVLMYIFPNVLVLSVLLLQQRGRGMFYYVLQETDRGRHDKSSAQRRGFYSVAVDPARCPPSTEML